jgi:hypothetical protein
MYLEDVAFGAMSAYKRAHPAAVTKVHPVNPVDLQRTHRSGGGSK